MRKIHLHGSLSKYGDGVVEIDVLTAAEAITALSVNFPGFLEELKKGSWHVMRGDPVTGMSLDEDMVSGFKLGNADLHFIPQALGAKDNGGTLKAILGVTLVVATYEASRIYFEHISKLPLRRWHAAAQTACFELVASLFLRGDGAGTPQSEATECVQWSKVFMDLFGYATGWLGWQPEIAWSAAPQEIATALNAHMEKLMAIHGGGEHQAPRETNALPLEEGMDPEFDLAGLNSLKQMAGQRIGEAA